MKKKLVLVIAVVLCLTMLLAGCNMFTVNAERDSDQVLGQVKHNGLVSEITKGEFAEYFATNFQTYNYYYGWTAQEAGDNFIGMIARQKMIVTLAVEKFAPNGKVDANKFNAINLANVKEGDASKGYDVYASYLMSLLNPDEQKYVKEQTNKAFEDAFKELVTQLSEADKITDDKEDETNKRKPRPTKPEKTETEFKADASIKPEDVDKIKDFFTEHKPNDKTTEYEKDAYNDLKKNLDKQYRTYNYYLAKQAETRLMAKYEEQYPYTGSIDALAEYNTILNKQETIYKLSETYKTDIEKNQGVIVFHNGQYVKIKSILLKFSTEQEALLKYWQKKYSSEDQKEYLNSLREMLVFGNIDSANLPPEINQELLGLKVYKSNPKYDPSKPETDDNLPYIKNPNYDPEKPAGKDNEKWQSVPFLEVISEIGADLKKVEEDAGKEYDKKYPNANDPVGKKMYIAQKRIEKFADWLYVVNDDDGMFNSDEYMETPFGNKSDYVAEFTGLVRQLLLDSPTAGSVLLNTDKGTAMSNGIVKTTAKVADDEVTLYTDKTNGISFVINDFGVHIVMLTTLPVDFGYNTEDKYTAVENKDFDMKPFEEYSEEEKAILKKANSFYTLHKDAYVGFDEKTGKAITVLEQLEKNLKETFDDYTYTEHEKKLFNMYGDKMFDASDDKEPAKGYENFKFELSYNKSVFNSVVSQYKKLEAKA